MKVLIVDDEKSIRTVLSLWLVRHGWDYFEAANGKEALLMLIRHPDVDLVISDINMPVMDGLTLGKIINKDFPIIFMSGNIDALNEIRKANLVSFVGEVNKPFTFKELQNKVTPYIS